MRGLARPVWLLAGRGVQAFGHLLLAEGWTAPSFLEAVTSGKVGTHDITEATPR